MRILFLTQVLPYPLNAGPKVRAYYVLRHLAERGHEVTLVSFVRDDDSPDSVAHLQGFCRAVHTLPMRRSRLKDARYLAQSLLSGRSFIIERDTDRAMHDLIHRLLGEQSFDVIHADQLWMAQYALNGDGVKRVLDEHNAVYMIPQRLARYEGNPIKRWVLEREWRALARYEGEVCNRFDHVVAVTEDDRALLSGISGGDGAHFSVIPICIDPAEKQPIHPRLGAKRMLVLGTMFYPPNAEGALWLAREVFPLVQRDVPDARLTVIGKNPPVELQRLGGKHLTTETQRAQRVLSYASDGGVDVLGYVAEPMPYLAESAVFAVPLRAGGGMRVKILDAWCWGLPIVSTAVGAEGIEMRDGENILIADDARSFADAVVRVMTDGALARRLRDNGRAWVEERYNWRRVYYQWDEVYARLRG